MQGVESRSDVVGSTCKVMVLGLSIWIDVTRMHDAWHVPMFVDCTFDARLLFHRWIPTLLALLSTRGAYDTSGGMACMFVHMRACRCRSWGLADPDCTCLLSLSSVQCQVRYYIVCASWYIAEAKPCLKQRFDDAAICQSWRADGVDGRGSKSVCGVQS